MSEHEASSGQQASSSCQLAERRVFVRLATDLKFTCSRPGHSLDPAWGGTARDISQGGVGLLLRHRFRPGTPLIIELRQRSGAHQRTVSARVVHATPLVVDGSSCWLLGCAFDQPLSEEELRALV
jgi:hypothetical protein